MKQLTAEEKFYIAGFLDGDGSIFAQMVRSNDYKYKYRIRISIGFYQNKKHRWFLMKLKNKLNCGTIRSKSDNVDEYIITGTDPVKNFLLQIKDCLVIKKRQANLMLEIIEKKKQVTSKESFIEICKLVDKIAALNYSKNKTITAATVAKILFENNNIL